jgi:hypothetical protein
VVSGSLAQGLPAGSFEVAERAIEEAAQGFEFFGSKADDSLRQAQSLAVALLPPFLLHFLPQPRLPMDGPPARLPAQQLKLPFSLLVGAIIGLHERNDCLVVAAGRFLRSVSKHIIESEYKYNHNAIYYIEHSKLVQSSTEPSQIYFIPDSSI